MTLALEVLRVVFLGYDLLILFFFEYVLSVGKWAINHIHHILEEYSWILAPFYMSVNYIMLGIDEPFFDNLLNLCQFFTVDLELLLELQLRSQQYLVLLIH